MRSAAAPRKQELARPVRAELLTPDKITNFIERVSAAIEPFVDAQKVLAKSISKLQITDQKTYDKAKGIRVEISAERVKAGEVVEEMISLANKLHKGLTGLRKPVLDLADANDRALSAKLRVFDEAVAAEQRRRDEEARKEAERKEREERERIEAEAAEARRKAEEAAAKIRAEEAEKARIAQEARERAEAAEREAQAQNDLKRQAEAAEARRAAERAQDEADKAAERTIAAESTVEQAREVEQVAEAAKHDPIDVGHVSAAPVIEKAGGPTLVDNWKGRCTSLELLVRFIIGVPVTIPLAHPELFHLLALNQAGLDAMANSQKGSLSLPGCIPWNDSFYRGGKK